MQAEGDQTAPGASTASREGPTHSDSFHSANGLGEALNADDLPNEREQPSRQLRPTLPPTPKPSKPNKLSRREVTNNTTFNFDRHFRTIANVQVGQVCHLLRTSRP